MGCMDNRQVPVQTDAAQEKNPTVEVDLKVEEAYSTLYLNE